jgi:DNA polymerase-4
MNYQRIIIHADLNSFFATAEQQANPTLRGKPVGVVKAKGRSCIIAASVEAKRFGVGTGSRVYDAKKLCPDIILIPANFAKYEYISHEFIKICCSYSPQCEVFSLDECFIDVTQTEQLWGNVFNIAFDIKKRLRDVGDYLTCSVGVSHNKFLAKLASNQIKPDGLFWITEDNMLEVLDKSKLTDVCGLGWGLERHLLSLEIDSFSKLRACSLEFLYKNFGPHWSLHLYNICRGVDNLSVTPIVDIADAKSVGRTYTTHRLLTKRHEIEKVMRNLCEEAATKARRMSLAGRQVSVCLREGHGGQNYWGHLTLCEYIDSGKKLFDLCKQISSSWPLKNIIFCGVTLSMLVPKKYQSIPLFANDQKHEDLIKSVDLANQKYGDYTVFPAQLLGIPIVMPEVTGFFGDKKYQLEKFKII